MQIHGGSFTIITVYRVNSCEMHKYSPSYVIQFRHLPNETFPLVATVFNVETRNYKAGFVKKRTSILARKRNNIKKGQKTTLRTEMSMYMSRQRNHLSSRVTFVR